MLKDQITNDLKTSLKEGSATKTGSLRMLLAAIQNKEIEKRKSGNVVLSDEDILLLVIREIKKRKEAIEFYEKGGRNELAKKESAEIKELAKYLPEPMPENEIGRIIREAIAETGASGAKDFGKVMGVVAKQTKGRADSKIISELIKKELGA